MKMGAGMGKFFHSLLVFGLVHGQFALACTTVGIPSSKEKVVAKSYDWFHYYGTVHVNLRGFRKVALDLPAKKALEWKSNLKSTTEPKRPYFLGGVNEKGLVMEIMSVGSKYPG